MIQTSLENHNQDIGFSQITDINLILADVKLIKCKYENLSFDISINNFVGLSKIIFMHFLEKNTFDPIRFKRSLFLIKSWCYYEGSILASNAGLLASYALEVLIIYMFNNYSDLFKNEIEAFFTFVKIMNDIDWDKQIITIFGCLSADNFYEKLKQSDFDLDVLIYELLENREKKSIIDLEEISYLSKTFEKFNDVDKIQNFKSKKAINLKYINIIDPLFTCNNLGKSVNYHNFSKIKKVFEYITAEVESILKKKISNNINAIDYLNSILKLFSKTIIANNPDLFFMSLPQPKIIILPSKNLTDKKKFNMDTELSQLSDMKEIIEISGFNESFTSEQSNSITLQGNNNNNNKPISSQSLHNISADLINLFNKKFSLENKEKKDNNNNNENCQESSTLLTPLINFFWPTK